MTAVDSPVSGRVVVVTGAASGIGHATAALFAAQGETVFGLDIRPTVPDGVTYVECDVADSASARSAIAVAAQHGRIDVLANVAGIVQFGRIETITETEWDRVQAVDLKGPFQIIQAALPHLRACTGTIVNVSSVAGRVPQPYATAYSAAKGGLTMITRSLKRALDRMMMMLPGMIAPAEIAAAVGYLASAEARFVTGSVLAIDGGMG